MGERVMIRCSRTEFWGLARESRNQKGENVRTVLHLSFEGTLIFRHTINEPKLPSGVGKRSESFMFL